MDPPPTGGPAAGRTANVSVSDLSRVRPEEDRFSEIAGRLGSVRPPSFQELAGTRLATLVLGVICGLGGGEAAAYLEGLLVGLSRRIALAEIGEHVP